jgi:hypothetical protein
VSQTLSIGARIRTDFVRTSDESLKNPLAPSRVRFAVPGSFGNPSRSRGCKSLIPGPRKERSSAFGNYQFFKRKTLSKRVPQSVKEREAVQEQAGVQRLKAEMGSAKVVRLTSCAVSTQS